MAGNTTHMRSAGMLPVIIEGRPGEPEWAEFDVVRFSREDKGEEWVFVGGDGTGWSVSAESACRIYRGLGAVLRVP